MEAVGPTCHVYRKLRMEFQGFIGEVLYWVRALLDYLLTPWFFYQAAIIAVLFLVAKVLSWRIEPKLEERARLIKGSDSGH